MPTTITASSLMKYVNLQENQTIYSPSPALPWPQDCRIQLGKMEILKSRQNPLLSRDVLPTFHSHRSIKNAVCCENICFGIIKYFFYIYLTVSAHYFDLKRAPNPCAGFIFSCFVRCKPLSTDTRASVTQSSAFTLSVFWLPLVIAAALCDTYRGLPYAHEKASSIPDGASRHHSYTKGSYFTYAKSSAHPHLRDLVHSPPVGHIFLRTYCTL